MSTGSSDGFIQIFGIKGTAIQQVRVNSTTFQRLSNFIPQDDTIPQNTEGTQILSASITPTKSTNILFIEAIIWGAGTTAQTTCCALFQDSNPNALACTASSPGAPNLKVVVPLIHSMSANTTSETTFTIRVGPDAGFFDLMGSGGNGRIYGGAGSSSLIITEYEA